MPITNQTIDISKMGVFSQINRSGNLKSCDDIVRLTGDNSLTFDKKWTWTNKCSRTGVDIEANNRTRAELLRSLGAALGVTGKVTEEKLTDPNKKGEIRLKFSSAFITELRTKLGADGLKALDIDKFSIKDGYVTSGKPLTERRVSFVNRFLTNTTPTDDSKTIQNLVRQRFTEATINNFKTNLGSDEQQSNVQACLRDLLPSMLGSSDKGSAENYTLALNLQKLGEPSARDPFELDKVFSQINSLVAKHNVQTGSRNKIAFFTPEDFFDRLKAAENKLADEVKSLVDLIEHQKIKPPTALNSENEPVKITKVDLKSCGYTMLRSVAIAAERTVQKQIVEDAIEQVRAAHDIVKKHSTRHKGDPTTKLSCLLSDLKNALTKEKTYKENRVDDTKMPKLSVTTGEVKAVLAKAGCTNLKDLVDLCKEVLQKMQDKAPETRLAALTPLKGALKALEPLFGLICGKEQNTFGDEEIAALEQAANVKIEPQIPDEAPQYPSTASREDKACVNLYSTYKLLGKDYLHGQTLLKNALKSARDGGRNCPDAVDFLAGMVKGNDTHVKDRFAIIFAGELASKASSEEDNGKADKLKKLLSRKIGDLINGQIKDITATESHNNLFQKIATNITNALNDDPEILRSHEFKQADVEKALVAGLHIHNYSKDQEDFHASLARKGGGLISVHSRKVTFNGKGFQSVVTPKNQVLHQHGIAVLPTESPLTNLALSEIKDETNGGKTLISFNRFGVVGTRGDDPDDIKARYRQLTIQTFLANPSLLEKVMKGDTTTVDLPIWRVDLADNNNLDESQIKKDGSLDDVTFKMKDANNNDIEVTLKPTVHHFHMPIDSHPPKGNNGLQNTPPLINPNFASDNENALKALQDSVKSLTLPENDKKRTVIKTLLKQIEDGFTKIESLKDSLPQSPDETAELQYGRKLTRLGARIAVLTSLLGNVPSINCNWGRDRTGAMDNECKLVALKVHDFIQGTEQEFKLEAFTDGTDEDLAEIQLRTRLLVETGNWDIARETNCTPHDINLHQSGYTDGTNTKTFSGFDTLFDTSKVVNDSYVGS